MSMIRALRTLVALENGTLTPSGLQSLLAAQARQDELRMLLATRSLFDRIAASKNTCAALLGSAIASSMLANQLPYRTELFTALFKAAGWKLALHDNDAMLTVLAGTPWMMAFARAAQGYAEFTAGAAGATPVSLSSNMPGSAYIVLGLGTSYPLYSTTTLNTKRSGSGIANLVTAANALNATTNLLAVPLVSAYSFVGTSGDTVTRYFGVLRCDA